jgi:two-component system, LytTR family, sensor kinase
LARSPISVSKFRIPFLGWWIIWSVLHALLLEHYGYSVNISMVDSLVTNAVLLATCWLISNILRYYLPYRDRYWYILLLTVTLALAANALCKLFLNIIFNDPEYSDYHSFLSNSYWLRLGIAFLMIACMATIGVFWYSQEEDEVNRQRQNDAEKLSKEAELYKLRQQLQPHFLFNSLNSISALIGSDPSQARKMIHQLSDFLRVTLKKEEIQWVKMEEELQSLELYLEIEKVRFGHRLSTHIVKDEESMQMLIPPLLLQPVVENAIKFGLYDTTEAVVIQIIVSKEKDYLHVIVKNPFDPETSTPRHGTGFGLNSIKRRLYLLFARTDLVNTNIEQQVFTTTIKIPSHESYHH